MKKRVVLFRSAVVCCVLLSVAGAGGRPGASGAQAGGRFVKRCGWFSNPTPANAWLDDRDGQWIIGSQGGHQAEGDWPEFNDRQWVRTNGNYGYGCACLSVRVNRKTGYVLEIKNAQARPLSACRKDKALKEPKE